MAGLAAESAEAGGRHGAACRARGRRCADRAPPRLRVLALETRLGTRYTADTLCRLAPLARPRFVWLMGADNLAQLPRWRRWRDVIEACPVAVFERHPYSYAAHGGCGGPQLCRGRRSRGRCAAALVSQPAPAWVFMRHAATSRFATAIRAGIAVSAGRQRPRRGEIVSEPRSTGSAAEAAPSRELLGVVTASLDDDKAIDPAVIDLDRQDHAGRLMVVATGTSQRHIASMAENLRGAAEGGRASTASTSEGLEDVPHLDPDRCRRRPRPPVPRRDPRLLRPREALVGGARRRAAAAASS